MPTITSGTSARGTPTCSALSTRKASLKRARVKTPPSSATCQKAAGSLRSWLRVSGLVRAWTMAALGSSRPKTSRATAMKAGITATQNTARKSLAQSSISPTASSGPRKAPKVSSDWRRP